MSAPVLPLLPPLDREFELLRELGGGGSAVVYLARDRELGRLVAVKVLKPSHAGDPEASARLDREARLSGKLFHPNITILLGARRLEDGRLALISERIAGPTLKHAVQQTGALHIPVVKRILTDVATALDYADRIQGLVHRDVKPENIFLDRKGGRVILADFGIARPRGTRSYLTHGGGTIGTPAYMSPEQVEGETLDGRSDLYSLGAVAWEMLTGRPPWEGETVYSVLYKQKNEVLPPLTGLRTQVPERLVFAVEKLLRKDADERWPDARTFLKYLQSVDVHGAGRRGTGPVPGTD